MTCPKCKAKIGITGHQFVLDSGVVNGKRCVMCGYWTADYPINHTTEINNHPHCSGR